MEKQTRYLLDNRVRSAQGNSDDVELSIRKRTLRLEFHKRIAALALGCQYPGLQAMCRAPRSSTLKVEDPPSIILCDLRGTGYILSRWQESPGQHGTMTFALQCTSRSPVSGVTYLRQHLTVSLLAGRAFAGERACDFGDDC